MQYDTPASIDLLKDMGQAGAMARAWNLPILLVLGKNILDLQRMLLSFFSDSSRFVS